MSFEAKFYGRCAADCGEPIHPGAQDAAWAPIVPDEAVEAGCREAGWDWEPEAAEHIPAPADVMRDILAAAAQFIVAANQPEPDGDLGEVIRGAVANATGYTSSDKDAVDYVNDVASDITRAVQSFVDSQVAAALALYVETPEQAAANDQTLAELRDALRGGEPT